MSKQTKVLKNTGKEPVIPEGWRLSKLLFAGHWHDHVGEISDWYWPLTNRTTGTILEYQIEKVEDEGHEAAQADTVGGEGRKDDSGKPRSAEVLDGFKRALNAVCAVGTWGGEVAYPDKPFDNWKNVPDGVRRYSNAAARHRLATDDNDASGLPHRFHVVWNELAALELWLKEKEDART